MRTLPRSHWEPPRPLQQGRSCEVSCPGCLVVFGPGVHISPQALGTGAATALPGTAAQPSPSAEGFGEVRAQPAPGEGSRGKARGPRTQLRPPHLWSSAPAKAGWGRPSLQLWVTQPPKAPDQAPRRQDPQQSWVSGSRPALPPGQGTPRPPLCLPITL